MRSPRKALSSKALRHVARIEMVLPNGRTYEFDIRRELRILNTKEAVCVSDHSERFVFWKRMQVELRRKRKSVEQEYNRLREDRRLAYAESIRRSSGRKPTDRELSAEVTTDTEVQALETKLNDCWYTEDLAAMMVEAFDHRRTVILKLFRA